MGLQVVVLDTLKYYHAKLLDFLSGKQDKLISGENIATINGVSLLNGGNITITETQGVIGYDPEPMPNSENLLTSGTIYNEVEKINNTINSLHTDEILFESSTPSYESITLSQSSSLYKSFEIYFESVDGVSLYSKIDNPNGKLIYASYNYIDSSDNFVSSFKYYNINEAAISPASSNNINSGRVSTTANDKHNKSLSNEYIGIVKVIGHK